MRSPRQTPARTGRTGNRYSVPPIKCGGEKAVLADQRVVEHHREGSGEHQAERTADDAAHDREIGNEARDHPADEGRGIGQHRKQRSDEQERRRIMPGEIAGEILAEQRELDLPLDVPVIGQRRMAIQHEPARRPDVDEIGGNAEPACLPDPHARDVSHREIAGVDDRERKAGVEQRGRNCAGCRRRGVLCGHAKSFARANAHPQSNRPERVEEILRFGSQGTRPTR